MVQITYSEITKSEMERAEFLYDHKYTRDEWNGKH
jgi:hypothetical protein